MTRAILRGRFVTALQLWLLMSIWSHQTLSPWWDDAITLAFVAMLIAFAVFAVSVEAK